MRWKVLCRRSAKVCDLTPVEPPMSEKTVQLTCLIFFFADAKSGNENHLYHFVLWRHAAVAYDGGQWDTALRLYRCSKELQQLKPIAPADLAKLTVRACNSMNKLQNPSLSLNHSCALTLSRTLTLTLTPHSATLAGASSDWASCLRQSRQDMKPPPWTRTVSAHGMCSSRRHSSRRTLGKVSWSTRDAGETTVLTPNICCFSDPMQPSWR
jgi:hypothetical protein